MHPLIALAAAAAATVSEPVSLPPKDDCVADASFRRFRSDLLAAAARKDAGRVTAMVSKDIMIDFGGGAGRDAFARAWKLDRPAESGLWSELRLILGLGCTLEGDVASAPSLMDQLPADRDSFMTVLVIKPGATLHEGPSEASPVIARANWSLLTLAESGGSEDWAAIALDAGGVGYIRRAHVRSPIDYRAVFQKRNGRWEMTVLVAGD